MKSHFRSEAPRHLPKLVALVLALALSACSGAVQTQSGSSKSKESFPWVTPTSINVGVLSPLTGPLAVQGVPETNGDKAFFAYVNEKFKGVYGRRIDMVAVDSQFNQQVITSAEVLSKDRPWRNQSLYLRQRDSLSIAQRDIFRVTGAQSP